MWHGPRKIEVQLAGPLELVRVARKKLVGEVSGSLKKNLAA